MTPLVSVITTIQPPTDSLIRLADRLKEIGAPMIIIGDKKGPPEFSLPGADFYSLKRQLGLPFSLTKQLPPGHYARKNIGYLIAFEREVQCIFETDDDNSPLASWQPRQVSCQARMAHSSGWLNVYQYFTDENIWPRGFPLEKIHETGPYQGNFTQDLEPVEAPIQQGLINLCPDVDAVWRLTQGRELYFHDNDSICLSPQSWCPFNSQSTWWWPQAYPLLYLPSYCPFRMTDIWRSFIAQRCLWELGLGIVFHGPESIQNRNIHNLMNDFEDEIPGYCLNRSIAEHLLSLKLSSELNDTAANLYRCYEYLVEKNTFPEKELDLVSAWIDDCRQTGIITNIHTTEKA